ncbi:MAG: TonB family protein [Rubrivivax sp.]|jgi:protein TonB|nr:TonB family protein [Rubrivivax sp.]
MVVRTARITALQVALGLSLAVHAGILTLRFVDPQAFERVLTDTPLEVILVNARSNEAPVKAQAIAQANLAGGGEAAEGRATSPLAASAEVRLGDTAEDARQRIDQMLQEQMQLLTQMRREAALMPPDSGADQGTPEQRAERERRRQMIKQLAEIEKRINEENARPRKRYVSPATSEAVYAVYYDAMRRKIEDRGTRDFPEVQGRKLYGELTMNVTVDARGRVVKAEVVRPSQSRLLDQRAIAIVRSAAPFGAFTGAMRRETDQIVVTSRFRFTREDGFEAQTLGSSTQGRPR